MNKENLTGAQIAWYAKRKNIDIENRQKLINEYIVKYGDYLRCNYAKKKNKELMSTLKCSTRLFYEIINALNLEKKGHSAESCKWSDEQKAKQSKRLKGKNTWSKGRKASDKARLNMHLERQSRSKEDWANAKAKEYETRKKNGSYLKHMTKQESIVNDYLIKEFGIDDIDYIHFDVDRYPFNCDFYIRSIDCFIEVNVYPSHGGKYYEGTAEDLLVIDKWKLKLNEGKKQYSNWIYTWTDLDVRKHEVAIKNDLNYICLYDKSSLIADLEKRLNDYKIKD